MFCCRIRDARDLYGNIMEGVDYISADKLSNSLMYIAPLRRIRKLTSTDSQDPVGRKRFYQ